MRPKVILFTDDPRIPTGVANMAYEIIKNTKDKIEWVVGACARQHPDGYKKFLFEELGVLFYTIPDGYGNRMIIRDLISLENPQAIMLFTDPRSFEPHFRMEYEIRENIPIIYYTIWDNYPAPRYNLPFYVCCDALMCISRQTEDIVRRVLGEHIEDKIVNYIPHGVDINHFTPNKVKKTGGELRTFFEKIAIDKSEIDNILKKRKVRFLWNSKNQTRKRPSDVIYAYLLNCKENEEFKNDSCLILHTQISAIEGTNLRAVVEELKLDLDISNVNIFFTANGALSNKYDIADLYRWASWTINNSDAEGFGLTSLESLLCGTPVIHTVTGGLQDQSTYRNELPTPSVDATDTNYNSAHVSVQAVRYNKFDEFNYSDEFAFTIPLLPDSSNIIGSPITPYIFEDRVSLLQVKRALKEAYDNTLKYQNNLLNYGIPWLLKNKFTATDMASSIADTVISAIGNFKPRKRVKIYEL